MSLFSSDSAAVNNAQGAAAERRDSGQYQMGDEYLTVPAYAAGGILNSPHLGIVAEAGREAIIPLEDKSRGIPLWQAAGEMMGIGGAPTQSGGTTITNSPTIHITIQGSAEPGIEQKIAEEVKRVLSELSEYNERVALA